MKSLSKKRIRTLAMEIINDVFPNNPKGFSMNPITGREISFTQDTYFVSKNGHELRCSEACVSLSIIQAWLLKNKSVLANCRYFLGEWYDSDTNEYVFDVSTKKNGKRPTRARLQMA